MEEHEEPKKDNAVTDLKYKLEPKLLEKLEFFCKMVTRENQKQDVMLCVHGKTGEGKTSSSMALAYYFKYELKRPVHMFFRLGNVINFAKSTEKKIIIWDEPAIDSLSTDQMTSMNKNFARLLNTMRKKRHILIVNITKFWRFNQDMISERCLALIHMHSHNGTDPGRFLYIRNKNLEYLYDDYRKYGKKNYGKYSSFGGRMPEVIEKVNEAGQKYFNMMGISIDEISNATLEDYERLKDRAIESIGEGKGLSKKQSREVRTLNETRLKIAKFIEKMMVETGKTREELAKQLDFPRQRIAEWRKIDLNAPLSLEKEDFETKNGDVIVNTMAKQRENDSPDLDEDLIPNIKEDNDTEEAL